MMALRFRHSGYGRYLRYFLALGDLVLFNLVLALTLWIFAPDYTFDYKLVYASANVAYLAVLARVRGVVHKQRAILLDRVVADSLVSLGLHALFFCSLTALLSRTDVPILFYVVYYGIMVVALPVCNVVSRMLIKEYRRRGYNYTRVVIVGVNRVSERLAHEMEADPGFGYRLMAFFDNSCDKSFRYASLYRGDIDSLAAFVEAHKVDQIYCSLPENRVADLQAVVRIADEKGIDFFFVPASDPSLGRSFVLHNIGAMPVLAARRNPLKNPLNAAAKRAFDIAVSSVFLVTVYPLVYLPVAAVIKLTSPGPVYFRQKRTGYLGKSFDCLKFRTMHVNNDADTRQATADDNRKTRFGDLLRRTSIDELPQFINVWKGDMSIVGPRPHMLKHTEDYSKLIRRYMARHIVKPGITGWAQVNGYRGVTDQLWKMERRVEYDVWYIENWTFLLDLKIMVRTVLNVFKGESNAY